MTRNKTMTRNPTATSQCRHHWVIDTPSGPTSLGVCLKCGALKEFSNYPADFPREGDSIADLSYNFWTKPRGHAIIPEEDEQ